MLKVMMSGCGQRRMNAEKASLNIEPDIRFPDPNEIDGDIIAVGGDLSPRMLLSAYRQGIFPWYSDDDPLLWWSLDPRFVIFPGRLHISTSLRKKIRKMDFEITVDKAFDRVISGCRDTIRDDQDGTWITEDMMEAYIRLHHLGYAHSVETWYHGELSGGLYGISMGGCYYGESMFARRTGASKVAFAALSGVLVDAGFGLIDCQQHTRHLASFGAVDMPRANFLKALDRELEKPTIKGNWSLRFPDFPRSELWDNLLRAGKG